MMKLQSRLLGEISDPVTSWKIDGETLEITINFIFLGSKITANGLRQHPGDTLRMNDIGEGET